MAATTKANVLLIAAELSSIDDAIWTLILADVATEVSSSVYGTKQERAQRYLAAHYLTLINASADEKKGVGPLSSEKVGQTSKSYAQINYQDRSRYDETSYGRIFVNIRKSVIIPFRVFRP